MQPSACVRACVRACMDMNAFHTPYERLSHTFLIDGHSFSLLQGLGKRKYYNSSASQHAKSTRNLMEWKGNESNGLVSTYRSHFDTAPSFSPAHTNESEPVHVRANIGLRRRQLRVSSAPPTQRRTAPLLAWNEPDESFHTKPGVGLRQRGSSLGSSYSTATPFAQTAPVSASPAQNYTVSETVTPLNCTT